MSSTCIICRCCPPFSNRENRSLDFPTAGCFSILSRHYPNNGSKWQLIDFKQLTHLLIKKLCLIPLFWLSQQEVEADHFAHHCSFFAPRAADDITGLSVVGWNRDHENQEWAFLLASVWFIYYKMVWMWVRHKVLWCWMGTSWDL